MIKLMTWLRGHGVGDDDGMNDSREYRSLR